VTDVVMLSCQYSNNGVIEPLVFAQCSVHYIHCHRLIVRQNHRIGLIVIIFIHHKIVVARLKINKTLEVLRERRPPSNASIIELLNDFCRTSVRCVDNVAVLPGSGS